LSTDALQLRSISLPFTVALSPLGAVGPCVSVVLLEMSVTSLALSLVVLLSPPPLTVAVFVTLAGAVPDTVTVSRMGGYVPCAARRSLRVHVTVCPLIAQPFAPPPQPVPFAVLGARPVGTESTTVTTAFVADEPTFVTVSV
jgi:hypothetical protein